MDDPKGSASLLVLARAGGRLREGWAVLHFLKKAVDDTSSDRCGKTSAFHVSLFAALHRPPESILEAP